MGQGRSDVLVFATLDIIFNGGQDSDMARY